MTNQTPLQSFKAYVSQPTRHWTWIR